MDCRWDAGGGLWAGGGGVYRAAHRPTGEVHDSVLWFFGECLIYAGSIFGIGIYVNGTVRQMRRELNSRIKGKNKTIKKIP